MIRVQLSEKVYNAIYNFINKFNFSIKENITEDFFIISSKNDNNFSFIYVRYSDDNPLSNTLLFYENTFKTFNSCFNDNWHPVIIDFVYHKFGFTVDEIYIAE